ncbi:branched-chain-amino-acid transaminase [Streptomyces bingchenggensis BCW-1]|uniref:Branched-chain-amino-acid transaminase n=1 Tax=Streptomyces bingchenggensis (strain BCW-1) TaxID=749414 RepID=D7CH99_STRBB|nr:MULTISPECIES: aminotransferase class IV [Streptomyces]ADI04934.1 branched-chain-amino-acid transaminase [Streptomyces bingchenggensis BCW-1]
MELLQDLGRFVPQYGGTVEHEVVYRPGNDGRAYSQSRNAIRPHTEAPGWHPSPRHLALYCHRQARCGGGHTDLLDWKLLEKLLDADDLALLTPSGHVSECSAANVFLVKSGVLHTPSVEQGILPGITRATVLDLARGAGITVVERPVAHAELYTADELFVTGTATGVVPVESLDDRPTTTRGAGPVTTALRDAYRQAAAGRHPAAADWLTHVGG